MSAENQVEGDDNVSERTTGATDEQIEAATDRYFSSLWRVRSIEFPAHRLGIVKHITELASYLVPPGYAIVPVAHGGDRNVNDIQERIAEALWRKQQELYSRVEVQVDFPPRVVSWSDVYEPDRMWARELAAAVLAIVPVVPVAEVVQQASTVCGLFDETHNGDHQLSDEFTEAVGVLDCLVAKYHIQVRLLEASVIVPMAPDDEQLYRRCGYVGRFGPCVKGRVMTFAGEQDCPKCDRGFVPVALNAEEKE